MSEAAILALDVLIVVAALGSGWFWWLASRQRLRRVSRFEDLDAADINRIVIALNRTQTLNARAALTTAAAAILGAIRLLLGLAGF